MMVPKILNLLLCCPDIECISDGGYRTHLHPGNGHTSLSLVRSSLPQTLLPVAVNVILLSGFPTATDELALNTHNRTTILWKITINKIVKMIESRTFSSKNNSFEKTFFGILSILY
jgi:hypothetical protein